MAAILEAYPLVAVDLKDDNLDLAKQFGAIHVVNASHVDPIAAIHEITNWEADCAFDTTGVPMNKFLLLPGQVVLVQIIKVGGGMAVLVGLPEGDITINSCLFVRG